MRPRRALGRPHTLGYVLTELTYGRLAPVVAGCDSGRHADYGGEVMNAARGNTLCGSTFSAKAPAMSL